MATDRRIQLDAQSIEIQPALEAQLLGTQPTAPARRRMQKASPQRATVADQMDDTTSIMKLGLYVWQLVDSADASSLTLISANSATQTLTGVSPHRLLGKRILAAFPALANTDIPEQYAHVVRTQQSLDLGEVLYHDTQVNASVFEVQAFPLGPDCVGVTFENITQLKKAKALQQAQAAQLKILFDRAAVGMARLSPEGHWIQVNQCLCNLLGYTMSELLEKTFHEVTHPDDADIDSEVYTQLVSGEKSQANFEKRYLTKQGEVVWAQVTISNVYSQKGMLTSFIATIQDITDRKQASLALKKEKDNLLAVNLLLTNTMSALEQRNEELDQFAYVTSHDLKAPLRAIANLTTWIEEDIGTALPPENIEQFDLLKSRVHRMEGLINGLLEYSRVGRTHQSHEQVDVAKLLIEVVDTLSPPDTFRVHTKLPMPVFQAKKAPLTQVFLNLVGNAIKHHNRLDGNVEIAMRELPDFYEFTITDDGPGIDTSFHQKIFTIFQTLQSRDELESTGIGLSIVQKTVVTEGGTISLESVLGRGSTFRFTWPKQPARVIT